MATPPPLGPSAAPTSWQSATVLGVRAETSHTRTFRLRLDRAWDPPHRAGQHVVLRLTAPDGYTASRSYSIANAPDGGADIELTVERLPEGEVSGFLHDVIEPGDRLEVRGPIGGWFTWDTTTPALLVAGGTGLVPLMAMLRHARRLDRLALVHLVVSVRSPDDLCYASELAEPALASHVHLVYSRRAPEGSLRPAGRLTVDDLPHGLDPRVTAYVCGSTGFADHATSLLLEAGLDAGAIRVERFGATG